MITFNERDDIRERYGKPQRPSINFTRRDDVRDLMKSPQGQNYGNMLDLQRQALRQGGFDRGDPRINELKDARRKYNRHDKYGIASLMGYSPQDVNEIYRQNSGVLREHARPTYQTMYPISDMAHAATESGGITGMLLNQAFGKSKKAGKNFFHDLRTMGSDILGAIGIGGAVPSDEATEEILENYADKTFGPYPTDIHPGLPVEDERLIAPPEENIPPRKGVDVVEDITVTDQIPGSPFFPGILANLFKRPKVIEGYDTTYIDEPVVPEYDNYIDRGLDTMEEIIPAVPFDDSNREFGILLNQGLVRDINEPRLLEKEYRDYIERSADMDLKYNLPPTTYEEFLNAYQKIHSLPRGLHYMEPRIGRR